MTVATPTQLFAHSKPENVSQLTEQLRMAVRTGVLAPGDQLPTIRDLSREIGLTTNVVSRAFANLQAEGLFVSRKRAGTFVRSDIGQGGVFEDRERVRIFALIGPELTSSYYPLLQRGFSAASELRGYQIISSNTDNDVHQQADTILHLIDKSISGVALVPATVGPSPTHHIRQLQRAYIPVVLLHRGVEGVSAPLLRIPFEQMGQLAAQRLIEAGHRRFAFASSHRNGGCASYEKGFRFALHEAGVELDADYVFYHQLTLSDQDCFARFEAEFERWFEARMTGPDRATALFTSFETIGEIAYLSAMRRGADTLRELALVTVGGPQRTGTIARRLACVTLDEHKAGQRAAELLDSMSQQKSSILDTESYPIDFGFDHAETLRDRSADN